MSSLDCASRHLPPEKEGRRKNARQRFYARNDGVESNNNKTFRAKSPFAIETRTSTKPRLRLHGVAEHLVLLRELDRLLVALVLLVPFVPERP